MKFFLLSILLTQAAWSQSFLLDIESINQHLAQSEMDKYLSSPSKDGIEGPILSTLMPSMASDTDLSCEEPKEPKDTSYEVILIAQASGQSSELEELPGQKKYFATEGLEYLMRVVPQKETSKGLSSEALVDRAKEIWSSHYFDVPSENFDAKTILGKELFIESLVHAAAGSNLNEKELTLTMASAIESVYKTEEEKFNLLSVLSSRLNRNYNDLRNPGGNNDAQAILPPGDMSVNDLMKGAAAFDELSGGVCNDISEAVAMVGEHLFPDRDVLVINGGTHFGVVITDGKENRVINGGMELRSQNRLSLDPAQSPTNMRINKVEDGALKQIAVVDTEMGQMTEAAFETGKKLLETDADISSIVGHFKKNNLTISTGSGKLSDSKVLIVVAKYEKSSDKWKSYLGAGASSQIFNGETPTKYQVHLRAGVERSIFNYVNSQTAVSLASGARVQGMYTLNSPESSQSIQQIDLSGGLDLYNRVDLNHTPKNKMGVSLNSSLEIEHSVGPKNWGNTTGALSTMKVMNTGKVLKNMTFHLNQVNADVNLQKPINSKLSGIVSGKYQGSNIGQSISLLAGLDIKIPDGAELLVFSGYSNSELPGFQTKKSLLASPSGAEVGIKYKNKNKLEFNGSIRGISSETSVNAGVRIPILNKKKKTKPDSSGQ